VVNGGAAQRSMVTEVLVRLPGLATGSFTLRPTLSPVPPGYTVTPVNPQVINGITFASSFRYAFPSSSFTGGSLPDGTYTPWAIASSLDGDTFHAEGQFHRLFGDADGDRDVDAADETAFKAAMGGRVFPLPPQFPSSVHMRYNSAFDFDADGDVDRLIDQAAFEARKGTSI
jgi:hypothetical protein